MNSRSSSLAAPRRSQLQRTSSVSSRLSIAISNAEEGEAANNGAERQIEEEIDEIKRYEVCGIMRQIWRNN